MTDVNGGTSVDTAARPDGLAAMMRRFFGQHWGRLKVSGRSA